MKHHLHLSRFPGPSATLGVDALLRWGLTALFSMLVVALPGCSRRGSEAQALRSDVIRATGAQWDREIDIGVGPVLLGLAGTCLRWVDVEPEIRSAVRAMHSVEVSVYRCQDGRGNEPAAKLLASADSTMSGRGWDRVVGVVNAREVVAIYLPGESQSKRNLRVCLLVLNERELVVVSAAGDPAPLVEAALERSPEYRNHRLLTRL